MSPLHTTTDAHTDVEHLVSDESVAAHRHTVCCAARINSTPHGT